MQVKVMNRMYRMNRKEYEGLLEIARDQVPFGIYAVEKKDYAELRCDRCSSMTQLKKLTRQFKIRGFKVMANTAPAKETGTNAAGETKEIAV